VVVVIQLVVIEQRSTVPPVMEIAPPSRGVLPAPATRFRVNTVWRKWWEPVM